MITAGFEMEPANSEIGYDMSDDQVFDLTAELIEDRLPIGSDRYICYMIDGRDRYADIGRKIECDVFNDSFNNDSDEMTREYAPYEERSIFFISVDREDKVPTGVLRVIKNGPAGLKTLNDIQSLPELHEDRGFSIEEATMRHGIENLDDCWDLGTVAVPTQYRESAGGVSLRLYRAMHVASQRSGIKHYVSIIDKGPFLKMKNFLGFPFIPIAGSRPGLYLGSDESCPVYGYAPKFEKAVRKKSWTVKGMLARKALSTLKGGRDEDFLQF